MLRLSRGGVCRNHLRTPIEEVSRRSRSSKESVSGPAASAMEAVQASCRRSTPFR